MFNINSDYFFVELAIDFGLKGMAHHDCRCIELIKTSLYIFLGQIVFEITSVPSDAFV